LEETVKGSKSESSQTVGYKRPKQNRSERTSERIIAAALELFSKKPFEEVSVGDIARKARVSIGGFYARFESKETLLSWFDEHFLDREKEQRTLQFSEDRWKGKGVSEVVEAYLKRGASYLRKYKPLLSRITLNVRGNGLESKGLKRAREFNAAVHQSFIDLLMSRKNEMCHPDPDFAITFALMSVTAAMREQILFGERQLNPVDVSDTKLVQELTRMFLNYIQSE
jgi:AcrR family transcriptional regulator